MPKDLKINLICLAVLVALYISELPLLFPSADLIEFLIFVGIVVIGPVYFLAANNPKYRHPSKKWHVAEFLFWTIAVITIINWGIESVVPDSHPGTYLDAVSETIVATSFGLAARYFKGRYTN
jgi:hypothetical protein